MRGKGKAADEGEGRGLGRHLAGGSVVRVAGLGAALGWGQAVRAFGRSMQGGRGRGSRLRRRAGPCGLWGTRGL
ncbi:hypothetical protein SGFS_057920 [Streptomyces graminofaciens]|uniref:Uncharacterized protein n=1 Tax=Streptomyces graminofaciens TaxID=68212 RepID=A0ABM7FE99_9ACTN|nr:hypothetical protein SGFS_057920 [Streptomyces graminofaciens]